MRSGGHIALRRPNVIQISINEQDCGWRNILTLSQPKDRPDLERQDRHVDMAYPQLASALWHIAELPTVSVLIYHATPPTTNAARPSSSVLALILTVTPLLALYAILTVLATLPPVMLLP